MVCEQSCQHLVRQGGHVLILVLMEDGLREENNKVEVVVANEEVLILVLMEDGLRAVNRKGI